MELRKFTDKGLERFRDYLHGLGEGPAAEPPVHLLTDPESSRSMRGIVSLEPVRFESRLHLARYLDQALEVLPERPDQIANDVHLWSWMSLFYFDQVCPANDKGRRKPGRDYRHIPEPGYPSGHRHLLAGPYLVYTVYGWGEALSKLQLHTSLAVESAFHHEIATRQSFITNRGIMEALHILYYDEAHGRPKRGPIMNRSAPGSLYRFIDLIQQLDVTYDLYSMSGPEIVSLLPSEFAPWMDRQLSLQTTAAGRLFRERSERLRPPAPGYEA
jgi:hypothetical protein